MAKINTGNFGNVVAQPISEARANPEAAGAAVGRAFEQAGAVEMREADELIQKERRYNDASAVFAARKQLDDWERQAVFDPEKGAIAKKGADSFGLPQSLPAEFDKAAGEIGKGLLNDRQKAAFQEVTASRRAQVGAFADRHALQQRQVYDEGQYRADVDSSLNRTGMLAMAGDLNGAAAETTMAQTRTVGYLRKLGRSEEEIAVATRDVSSKATVVTINMLLENDKALQAEKYMKDNAAKMSVEDLLRSSAAVEKATNAVRAADHVDQVMQATVTPALRPTDSGRLVALVMNEESRGRRYGPDGKTLLTSPKGAKGEMQVLDGTNKDPGFGVKPAKDDSPEERARVGRDYLSAMVTRYGGDINKALAAYNGGPGRVDQAIKDAAKGRSGSVDWLSYMPDETKTYVANITKQYTAGEGSPQMPTLESVHEALRARIPKDQPQLRKLALDEATRRYADSVNAKKQGEDANYTAALDWLQKNNGDFTRMPAGLRSNLPPGKVDEAMTFAGKINAGVEVQTDWNTYTQLRAMATANPQRFASTDLRMFYPVIGKAQREQLLDLQTKVNDPKEAPKVRTLDAQLSDAHDMLSITGEKNAEKRGKFDDAVSQEVALQQRQLKRELTFEERDKVIKRLMLPVGDKPWFGAQSRAYEKPGEKPTPTDDDKKLITAALKADGVPVTDANIRARFNLRHGIQ